MTMGIGLHAFAEGSSCYPCCRLGHEGLQPRNLGGEPCLWQGSAQDRELSQCSVELGLPLGCAGNFCTDAEFRFPCGRP